MHLIVTHIYREDNVCEDNAMPSHFSHGGKAKILLKID